MLTLEIREYQSRVRRRLTWAFVVISVVTLAFGVFLPGRPLISVLLGVTAAGALLATTTYTMNRMVNAEGMALGWVAIDYLVKVVVVIGTLLVAKYVAIFDPIVVAIAVVMAIVATAAIQVSSVKMKQQVESDFE